MIIFLQCIKKYLFSILILIGIFYLSTASFSSLSDMPKIKHIDKLVHLLMFACLTLALSIEVPSRSSFLRFGFVLVFPVLYGAFVELVQAFFFPPRTADFFDFLADVAGVVFGYLFAKQMIKNKSFKKILQLLNKLP